MAVWATFSLNVLILSIYSAESASLEPPRPCIPSAVARGPCHTCICSADGIFECRHQPCKEDSQKNTVAAFCEPNFWYRDDRTICSCNKLGFWTSQNCKHKLQHITHEKPSGHAAFRTTLQSNTLFLRDNLPEINEGESCVPGKSYRMDCNTCRCTEDNGLLCTKMGCVNPNDILFKAMIAKKKIPILKQGAEGSSEEMTMKTVKMTNAKTVNKNYTEVKKIDDEKTEKIPELNKICIPGKVYRTGCHRCFCDDKNVILCSMTACEKQSKIVRTLEDVSPPIPQEAFDSLPSLPHEAAECEPGKTYKVDCNTCRCLHNKNLLCTKMLCLSPSEVNRIEAARMTGKSCREVVIVECVQCDCTNGKHKCWPIPNCLPKPLQKELNTLRVRSQQQLRFDISDDNEKCIPGMVYKSKCNNCYCQENLSLRCTRKGCLNYTQIKKLERQRVELLMEDLTRSGKMAIQRDNTSTEQTESDTVAIEDLAQELEEQNLETSVVMNNKSTPYFV